MISNHALKKKQSAIKQSMAATGGGKQSTEVLTPQEEQVLNIISPTSVHGHPNIGESSAILLQESDVSSNKNIQYFFVIYVIYNYTRIR